MDEQLLAVPRAAAARLAGVPLRRLDYWASTGLIGPSIDRTLGPGRRVRLYEFVNLLALMVAAQLRERGVSLRHIRQIVAHLLERGYDEPLTQLRFATVGHQVYFQHADGEWEGGIRPDQLVLHQVLDLELIRRKIAEGIERRDDELGRVERRRGVLGGKPVFAGTRIPVDTVRRYLEDGASVEELLEAYPSLSRADVDVVRGETVA
ncbi:MAG: DUF433 domain-containing protein [Actinomycetota bacterium]|nr:DUF433 domain-containing protein [Actinomycetota bacterium]